MNYEQALKILTEARPNADSSCFRKERYSCTYKYDVDVIIPCYNVGKYVEDCITSVLEQKTSYTFRIIAINDGSKDNTAELLKKFRDLDNVMLLSHENQGLSYTRNRALDLVEAEYVLFLDSDDMLYPGAIEKLVKAAKSENADYVQGKIVQMMTDGTEGSCFGVCVEGEITTRRQIAGIPGGKLFSSSLFSNLRFPRYIYEDSIIKEIVFDLAKKKVSISAPVYKYRINPNGISASAKKNFAGIDGLWINLKLSEDRLKSFGIQQNQDYYEYKISTFNLLHNRVKGKGAGYSKACFKVYSRFINSYFPSFVVKNSKLKLLEKALRKDNYLLFRISRIVNALQK